MKKLSLSDFQKYLQSKSLILRSVSYYANSARKFLPIYDYNLVCWLNIFVDDNADKSAGYTITPFH